MVLFMEEQRMQLYKIIPLPARSGRLGTRRVIPPPPKPSLCSAETGAETPLWPCSHGTAVTVCRLTGFLSKLFPHPLLP